MKVAVFSTRHYDSKFLEQANLAANANHEFVYFNSKLEAKTVTLAQGCSAICAFVNDDLGEETLKLLADCGVRYIVLRCTGFNNVDLSAAATLGIKVARVSHYSPYSVAEFAVGLIMMLNRKLYRAYNRVRDDNFALDGLMGFDLQGCIVGVVGTGKIGRIFGRIMQGFGCRLLAFDPFPHPEFTAMDNAKYTDLTTIWQQSDIISLHCPLTSENFHLIDKAAIAQMKPGMMLINTSRGKLIDTKAVIEGIKLGIIGYLGIDVYEEEDDLFFEDFSDAIIQDDTFQLLQSFPNVVITGHQAFFTQNAISQISEMTISNLSDFEANRPCPNVLDPATLKS